MSQGLIEKCNFLPNLIYVPPIFTVSSFSFMSVNNTLLSSTVLFGDRSTIRIFVHPQFVEMSIFNSYLVKKDVPKIKYM